MTSYSAIHQRLLDGLAAGGFFLLRQCPYDTIHGPIERLLSAVDRSGMEPDRLYRHDEMPEVAAAIADLPEIHEGSDEAGHFLMPAGELERYREVAAEDYRRVAGAVFD